MTAEMDVAGARITLRELVEGDWAAIHDIANRPGVYRFQPWAGSITPEATRDYVRDILRASQEDPRREYTLAAVLRSTGAFVGWGSLWVRHSEFRNAEIGYTVHPDHWGQGVGTEIAHLLLRLGFERLHLHRIWATTDPRHAASIRVLEKNGMIHEGRLRDTMLLPDGWRDSEVFGILEDEWTGATWQP